MEEDIKLIEDFLLGKKMQYGSGYIGFKEFIAIENLIKDYKDLHLAYELYKSKNENLEEKNKNKKTIKGFEEENIEVSKFGEWVGKDYIDYKFEYKNYQRILADSIPISVIQNKIDEYREKRNKLADGHFWDNERNINEDTSLFIAIETLKLLLKERNK